MTVSASIGSSNLQLPETEFTTVGISGTSGLAGSIEDFDGHYEDAVQYDAAIEGMPTGIDGVSLAAKGFYADYDNRTVQPCQGGIFEGFGSLSPSQNCGHLAVIDPSRTQVAPSYQSQTTVNSDVENWGVALESQFASPISPLVFKSGLAYKTIDQDMRITWDGTGTLGNTAPEPGIPVESADYKESLQTDYWGGFVGLEASREFVWGINLSLGGEIGIYHGDTDYDGSISTNVFPTFLVPGGSTGQLSLSRDELTFIASVQGEAGVNFGLFNIAAFAHGEWYSYAPDMDYAAGGVLKVDQGDSQISLLTGPIVGETEIKHGQAWTITGGAKVTVPLSMPDQMAGLK